MNSIEIMRKNFREEMPITAAIVDELRAAFGDDGIDQSIKSGMSGVPTFYARENGHEVGTRSTPGGTVLAGTQMVLQKPFNPGRSK